MGRRRLDLPGAEVEFDPEFFRAEQADDLLREILATTEWRQDFMSLFGRVQPLPRLTAWYGDPGKRYTYSGIVNEPMPWTPVLEDVRNAVEVACGAQFNGVLLNLYRDGSDGMGWHADDEPEFGENPVIASVSFGATRRFRFKGKHRKDLNGAVDLTHGSLLIMRGETQTNWLHQIPKTERPVDRRVNLTFRRVVAPR
jgi:alkylated DNA repair dioxygenase AlkB